MNWGETRSNFIDGRKKQSFSFVCLSSQIKALRLTIYYFSTLQLPRCLLCFVWWLAIIPNEFTHIIYYATYFIKLNISMSYFFEMYYVHCCRHIAALSKMCYVVLLLNHARYIVNNIGTVKNFVQQFSLGVDVRVEA